MALKLKNTRTMQVGILKNVDEDSQKRLLKMQEGYLNSIAFIISQASDIGDVEL